VSSIEFDYQTKVWGTALVSGSPFSLAGLRFYYFLRALRGVRGKLLEIGCGAGGNLQGLRRYRPYLELYGVDIGVAAIDWGKKHFPVLHLRVAPAEQLPFPDAYFSCVGFFDVLEHVVDVRVCLAEAFRVSAPGGILHAYVPVEGELLSLHGILNACGINLKEKPAGHIQKLTRKEVERLCVEVGFTVTEVTWSCHYLNQIGDLLYYAFLSLTHRSLTESLEGTITRERNVLRMFLGGVKSVVALVWYCESRLLWFFPGAGIHITCRK
jgi:ubiquinone/menaquinone biosynthesis C-methylase UbiE